jgi:hypothetical protein
MKGEERFVCHFYRSSNLPCKVRTHHRERGAQSQCRYSRLRFMRVCSVRSAGRRVALLAGARRWGRSKQSGVVVETLS